MGGTKTKTVGGGAAAPLANEWYSFLSNTLKGGNSPGSGSVQNMFGGMLPNTKDPNTPIGLTTQLGSGTVAANNNNKLPQDTYLGMGRPNFDPTSNIIGSKSEGFNPGFGNFGIGAPPPRPNLDVLNPGGNGGGSAVNTTDYGSFSGADMRSSSPVPGASGGVPFTGPISGEPRNSGGIFDRFVNPIKDLVNQNKPNVPGLGGFSDAMSSMLNPDVASMIQNNPFLSGLMNYDPTVQLPNAPTWSGTDFSNPNQITPGNVGYNNAAAGTTDINSFMSQFGGDPSKLLQSVGINPGGMNPSFNVPGLNGPSGNFDYSAGTLKDFTKDPSFMAISQMVDRDLMKKTANLRERFSLGGNTNSSGASLAEAQLAAEATPQKIAALQGLGREIQGLDLQQQGVNNNLRTSLLGSQVQDALGRYGISADLQKAAGQIGSANQGNLLNFLTSTQGQNIGAATSLANNNAGNITNVNVANSQGGLDASKANAGNSLQAQIANANNVLDMNRIRSGETNARNTFNQNNYSIGSSNLLNNKNMQNQFAQFLGSQGINLQQLAQTGQMGIISQLFNSFQQAAGIGTPQAQTVQQPSALSQALNFGLGAAGTIGGIMSSNPAMALGGVGSMAGSFQTPQISPLSTPRNLYPTSGIS